MAITRLPQSECGMEINRSFGPDCCSVTAQVYRPLQVLPVPSRFLVADLNIRRKLGIKSRNDSLKRLLTRTSQPLLTRVQSLLLSRMQSLRGVPNVNPQIEDAHCQED